MILIRLAGGLGNQLFQYALGTYLAGKNHTELKIDLTLLEDKSIEHKIFTHREYDLNAFHLPVKLASPEEIKHFNGHLYSYLPGKLYNQITWALFRSKRLVVEKQRNFQPDVLNLPDDRCLVGAWQSEKYFIAIEQEIRKLYAFPDTLTGDSAALGIRIKDSNSLCVNVRRGDLVTSPLYEKMLGAMPPEYFQKGFEQIAGKEKIETVYVFTDDPEWAREHLRFPVATEFVGAEHNGPRYVNKLHLMSLCRHFIIPNSTFSWWAAWLSTHPDKKVVAPKQWFRDPSLNSDDIVPDSWTRI